MVDACERAAVRGAYRNVRMDDYKTWDKATWHRYLEAVARLEPDYMPQMGRLLRDIDRFERLLTLPIAAARPRHEPYRSLDLTDEHPVRSYSGIAGS